MISIVDQVADDPGYALQADDVRPFEKQHGRIPGDAVEFVRSDWSKDWPDPKLATKTPFPAVSLGALKLLHEKRHVLIHGHEPLDTEGFRIRDVYGFLCGLLCIMYIMLNRITKWSPRRSVSASPFLWIA